MEQRTFRIDTRRCLNRDRQIEGGQETNPHSIPLLWLTVATNFDNLYRLQSVSRHPAEKLKISSLAAASSSSNFPYRRSHAEIETGLAPLRFDVNFPTTCYKIAYHSAWIFRVPLEGIRSEGTIAQAPFRLGPLSLVGRSRSTQLISIIQFVYCGLSSLKFYIIMIYIV